MNFQSASASVVVREAMRELDARTIAAGTPSLALMESAGQALADALADSGLHGVALSDGPRLLVLAGRGSNGGDGFVVARLLEARGWFCTVALVGGEPSPGGDAATNLAEWRRSGGLVIGAEAASRLLRDRADEFDLALDAIFGTGLARPVEGDDAEFIHHMNQSGLPIIAADVPSGLCSDTGVPLGAAVRCRATVTLGAAKPGLFLDEGPVYCGRVRVADIELLEPAEAAVARVGVVLDGVTTAGSWPRLSPLSHKGSRGHVLIVAGSRGKTGAAVLAARGALRAGAGLVTVACVPEVQMAVSAALPEAMTRLLAQDPEGCISLAAIEGLASVAKTADSIVVGPGLGTGPGADAAVALLLEQPQPLVIDADGLNALSLWDDQRIQSLFAARTASGAPAPILTPHPGEMGRLVDATSAHVQLSRMVFSDNFAKELGAVVVLKGAATIVADGRGGSPDVHGAWLAFNLSGNAGMACAGMGDVLSGVCAAIAVRVIDPFEAAGLAVYVHGAAGDLLAARSGPGFLAGELADEIPAVLASRHPR